MAEGHCKEAVGGYCHTEKCWCSEVKREFNQRCLGQLPVSEVDLHLQFGPLVKEALEKR